VALFTAAELADAQADLTLALSQTATVYGEDPTTGAYTVVLKTGMACALVEHTLYRAQFAVAGNARAENLGDRTLLWDPAYALPETAQLLIGTTRWQPVAGTFVAWPEPPQTPIERRCEVIRIQVTAF
jgi:hypothetical protein